MSDVLLSSCERTYDPLRVYDCTLSRMYAEIDVCKEPDYVGDHPRWFHGASLSDVDFVSSQISFSRTKAGLDMTISDGTQVSTAACVAVLRELFSSHPEDDHLNTFEIVEIHQSPAATTATKFVLVAQARGVLIKSIQKN